jgi:glycine/D-amino acid oxidase-like deaminating enzyme
MSPPSHLVVIGGGVQGSSVAYFASQMAPSHRPGKITLIEANSHLAPHASGKGGGFMARSTCANELKRRSSERTHSCASARTAGRAHTQVGVRADSCPPPPPLRP